ncbi:hypothetical protein [Variovorax sp. UC122_21]|uniref:hypothetical protein n=1 Tax=Variovorax sp. UC122_21 TaxID=3374554 RepID=UPI003756B9F9
MTAITQQSLFAKIKALSPEQVAQVDGFVESLSASARRHVALDRLLAIAPALEAAGVTPMSEDELQAEIDAARAERRARRAENDGQDDADRGSDAPRP